MSWKRFFRRARWDAERARELEAYLQIETDENLARGLPPEEARAAACKKLGNATQIREEIYRMNTLGLLDSFLGHLRHMFRGLVHTPAFTAAAVLTLALGIGASAAMFSLLNSVLIQPLPYPNAERLVGIWHIAPGLEFDGPVNCSPTMYFTYRENNRSFAALGLWSTGAATITGMDEPEEVPALYVTQGTLDALNVAPAAGRWFTQSDDSPDAPETIILTHGYWQRRFGSDRSVVGSAVMVGNRPRQVIGVMPPEFRFLDEEVEVILPLRFDRSNVFLGNFSYQGIARLEPGVTIQQANTDLDRMLESWPRSWPPPRGASVEIFENWQVASALQPLKQEVVGHTTAALWVVMCATGLMLLIATANVGNLLLVRAESRRREFAIRTALGAGRRTLIPIVLGESLGLSLAGGALGILIAHLVTTVLVRLGPDTLPRLHEVNVDLWSLGYVLIVTLISGLGLGVIPAARYAGPGVESTLRATSRTAGHGRKQRRARSTLVVVQTALAVVLVIGSGLMIRTFHALTRVDPGFAGADQIQSLRITIPASPSIQGEQITRIQNEIQDRLAAIPSVAAAAFASSPPMGGFNRNDATYSEDRPVQSGETPPIRVWEFISPGFFETMGTPLVAGRDFDWSDVYNYRPVVIVSENLARELWRDPATALGRRIRESPDGRWREVIGVVKDIRDNGPQESAPTTVYWPYLMEDFRGVPRYTISAATFFLRSPRIGSEALREEIQQAVWSVDPGLPLASLRTMQEIYGQSMARTSFTLVVLTTAGVVALILGIVGIYGIISYVLSQRHREIAIRLALGARPGEVKRRFLKHGLTLASVGIALGLGAAVGLTRLMSSLLFEVSPLDPATYAVAVLVLVASALLASYLPARRASAVNPVEAMKAD